MNKTNNIVIIIKTLLTIHKLTQVDFAIKTGIPLATVKKYLQGAFNPTVKNINKIELCFDFYISKILKIDLDNIDELEKIEGAALNTGRGDNFAPQIISVSFEDIRAEVLLHALEDRGIYVSSGSACSSNHPGISGSLKAVGVGEDLLDATIRISLSELNNMEEAKYCIENLRELLPLLRKFVRK